MSKIPLKELVWWIYQAIIPLLLEADTIYSSVARTHSQLSNLSLLASNIPI